MRAPARRWLVTSKVELGSWYSRPRVRSSVEEGKLRMRMRVREEAEGEEEE